MNEVIYVRYSSSKQKDTSIEAQLKEFKEYCRNNNYKVIMNLNLQKIERRI